MSEFHKFAKVIYDRFQSLQSEELYTVDLDGVDIFGGYLAAFPEGTNPIYRVRTVHDGSIDKNFIRRVGHVVAIRDGELVSIWDAEGFGEIEGPYDLVAEAMSSLVKSLPIKNVFRTRERKFGAQSTIELLEGNETHKWFHFHADVDRRYHSSEVATALSGFASIAQVFRRGLEELSLDALHEVSSLIDQSALYRGEEHHASVKAFIALKTAYQNDQLSPLERDIFVWENIGNRNARFRNTVIGTLVQDLSEGVDLEKAVKSFETKVAPSNYKRTTALITPKMVEDAMGTVRELGLEPALDRRFARLSDVSVTNVLFVDNSVQGEMKGGVEGLLMEEAKAPKSQGKSKATQIAVDDFFANVLPGCSSVSAMVKSAHSGNFMSLTAPSKEGVKQIFKWDNNFGWSYDGNITDSIKERVKRAGGNVDASLRVSLAWFNSDDLDIHVHEPGGRHICYSNKCGILDVDMNVGGPSSLEPVENMQWVNKPADGKYRISVNNYSKRSSENVGFTLEVECDGYVAHFSYDKAVKSKETVKALEIHMKNGAISKVDVVSSGVFSGSSSIEKWGITTEQFVPVNSIMLSPNHWDDNSTGNRHWFFLLQGCHNPEKTRGIYNEFLTPELEKHRKVFEILGDKTKCEPDGEQLSGIGFSSTKRSSLLVLADGRPYEVQF